MKSRFLHGPAVDQVFAAEDDTGDILWALADNQGTVRDVADYNAGTDTTTVANHRKFDAFGNITAESNSSIDFRYAYTGRYFDEDSDLKYNRARWYDGTTGRWISEDPIGFAAGDANLSRYVGNSPANATDLSGLSSHPGGGPPGGEDSISIGPPPPPRPARTLGGMRRIGYDVYFPLLNMKSTGKTDQAFAQHLAREQWEPRKRSVEEFR